MQIIKKTAIHGPLEAAARPVAFKGGAPPGAFHGVTVDSAVEKVALDSGTTELAPTLRTFFPETWLWELVPTG